MTDTSGAQVTAARPATKRPRKMARDPEVAPPAPTAQRINKSDLIVTLLKREGGATLDEMIAATSWLPHTTRAALTGLKKKGHQVMSEKADGVRRYRIESSVA